MSYCRWSCMDFACDLYAYESSDGYTIHVAGNRVVGDVPPLPAMSLAEKYVKALKKQLDFLAVAPREDIDLPHAGETFVEADLESFEARLLSLRALGYRFPDYVLDQVRAELIDEIAEGMSE